MSCGACHDGINWATGGGSTLADNQAATYPTGPLATTGHVGRGQADDSKCRLCHTPEYVAYDHRLENITKNNPGVLPGLASFKYEIQSAAVNSTTNDLTIVFRVLKGVSPTPPAGQFLSAPADADYAPVTFVAPAAGLQSADRLHRRPVLPAGLCDVPGRRHCTVDYNNLGIKKHSRSACRSPAAQYQQAATIGTMSGPDAERLLHRDPRRSAQASRPAPRCARWRCRGTSPRSPPRDHRVRADRTPCHLGHQGRNRRHRAPHGRELGQVRQLPRVVRRPRRQPRLSGPSLRGLPRAGHQHQRPPDLGFRPEFLGVQQLPGQDRSRNGRHCSGFDPRRPTPRRPPWRWRFR